MKNNQVIPMFLFILLTFASAMAASSPEAVAPAGTAIPLGDFLCNLSQTTSAELPGSTPAPTLAQGTCGTCGDPFCYGKEVGRWCGYKNGQPTWCIPRDLSTCVDGSKRCFCETKYN